MLSPELLKKVKRIQLAAKKRVSESLSGAYKSQFKGQGVQFSEHRQYIPGDDVRHINWNVSARTKEPLVKLFEEERELALFLVVDISASTEFGTLSETKREIAANLAALLSLAASKSRDQTGLLLFTSRVEKILPPQSGRSHSFRILKDLLDYTPQDSGTNLAGALEATQRVLKHRSVVFLIIDGFVRDYEKQLLKLTKRNEVIVIVLEDPRDFDLPAGLHFLALNPETGQENWINTSSYSFQKWFAEDASTRRFEMEKTFKRLAVESLWLNTHEDCSEQLIQFLLARAKSKIYKKPHLSPKQPGPLPSFWKLILNRWRRV